MSIRFLIVRVTLPIIKRLINKNINFPSEILISKADAMTIILKGITETKKPLLVFSPYQIPKAKMNTENMIKIGKVFWA